MLARLRVRSSSPAQILKAPHVKLELTIPFEEEKEIARALSRGSVSMSPIGSPRGTASNPLCRDTVFIRSGSPVSAHVSDSEESSVYIS